MVSERMNELEKRKQEESGLGGEKEKKTNLLLNPFPQSLFFFFLIFQSFALRYKEVANTQSTSMVQILAVQCPQCLRYTFYLTGQT